MMCTHHWSTMVLKSGLQKYMGGRCWIEVMVSRLIHQDTSASWVRVEVAQDVFTCIADVYIYYALFVPPGLSLSLSVHIQFITRTYVYHKSHVWKHLMFAQKMLSWVRRTWEDGRAPEKASKQRICVRQLSFHRLMGYFTFPSVILRMNNHQFLIKSKDVRTCGSSTAKFRLHVEAIVWCLWLFWHPLNCSRNLKALWAASCFRFMDCSGHNLGPWDPEHCLSGGAAWLHKILGKALGNGLRRCISLHPVVQKWLKALRWSLSSSQCQANLAGLGSNRAMAAGCCRWVLPLEK